MHTSQCNRRSEHRCVVQDSVDALPAGASCQSGPGISLAMQAAYEGAAACLSGGPISPAGRFKCSIQPPADAATCGAMQCFPGTGGQSQGLQRACCWCCSRASKAGTHTRQSPVQCVDSMGFAGSLMRQSVFLAPVCLVHPAELDSCARAARQGGNCK